MQKDLPNSWFEGVIRYIITASDLIVSFIVTIDLSFWNKALISVVCVRYQNISMGTMV